LPPRAIDDLVLQSFHASSEDPLFLPEIHSYQIVQEAPDRLVVRVETPSTTPPLLLARDLEAGLRAFHPDLTAEIEFVRSLPRGRTGKVRRVVSNAQGNP
jgi:hypothetical protein